MAAAADDDDNDTLWAVIGALIGGLAVVVAVVVRLVRRLMHQRVRVGTDWTRPKPDGFEVSRDRLVVGKKIGSGEFGIVSAGRIASKSKRGSVRASGRGRAVAIKQLGIDAPTRAQMEDFLFEGTLMKPFHHPNLVRQRRRHFSARISCALVPPYNTRRVTCPMTQHPMPVLIGCRSGLAIRCSVQIGFQVRLQCT